MATRTWWDDSFWWYQQHFLRSFLYYLPLVLLLVLPILALGGALLGGLGITFLFFRDDPAQSFVVGASLAIYFTMIFALSYLLWLKDLREKRIAPFRIATSSNQPADVISLGSYTVRIIGCIAATGLVAWITIFSWNLVYQQTPSDPSDPTSSSGIVPSIVAYVFVVMGFSITGIGLFLLAGGLRKYKNPIGILLTRFEHGPTTEDQPVQQRGFWIWFGGVIRFVLIVILWAALIALVYWPNREKFSNEVVTFLIRLLIFIFAIKLISTAWQQSTTKDSTKERVRFYALGITDLIVSYCLMTWCISQMECGFVAGVLVFALGILLTALELHWFCKQGWDRILDNFRTFHSELGKEEASVFHGYILYCALSWFALSITIFCPLLNSPVSSFLSVLCGLVMAYGLFMYVIRRAFIPAMLLSFGIAVFSSANPYKMSPLDIRNPAFDLDKETTALDLSSQIKADKASLDALKEAYLPYLEVLQECRSATGKQDPTLIDLKPYAELRQKLVDTWKAIPEAWQKVEKNQIIAGQFPNWLTTAQRSELQSKLSVQLLGTHRLRSNPRLGIQNESRPPLILVSVSGGGSVAAVWTFLVLKELEKACDAVRSPGSTVEFSKSIRLINGASGGMLGAGYYVATLPQLQEPESLAGFNRNSVLDMLQDNLASDFLTPIARRMVLNDLPGLFSPWKIRVDRGKELERAWATRLINPYNQKPALDVTFKSLQEFEIKREIPSLIFSPMMVEDGRRLLISNLDLRSAVSNDVERDLSADHASAEGFDQLSQEGLELFRLFPKAIDHFPLSTAIRMSATFPYFSPAVTLPTAPRRRLVDAGYYDNYGINLNTAWVFSKNNQEWIKENFERVILIQIRAFPTMDQRRFQKLETDISSVVARTFEELTSPVEALSNVRVSSSTFRNDNQLELFRQATETIFNNKPNAFRVATVELPLEVPLNWTLSKEQYSKIKEFSMDKESEDSKIIAFQTLLNRVAQEIMNPRE
jgi:hypothetical protein